MGEKRVEEKGAINGVERGKKQQWEGQEKQKQE